MSKKFEVNLTPQNEEWINLIPNASKNIDIIFNKLIETSINEGLLLEIISQSLTLPDLKKFKTSYGKMQTSRAGFLQDLNITPQQIERKRVTQTVTSELDDELVEPEPPKKTVKKVEKKSGWDEDTF